jgi:hypothetical protein
MFKSNSTTLAGNIAGMREKMNTYRVLAAKPGGKRPLGTRKIETQMGG